MGVDPLWTVLVFLVFWIAVTWAELDLRETVARRRQRDDNAGNIPCRAFCGSNSKHIRDLRGGGGSESR